MPQRREVFTLGYDALAVDHLVELLADYRIEIVVDVRRWGRSVRAPQYSTESLSKVLARAGIHYVWIPELGGYRRFGVDVEDVGIGRCFRSEGFRAYATYVLTSEVAGRALERLLGVCSERTAALLCRERLPYRCHRKILSDWLLYKGFRVVHLIPPGELEHRYTKCARIVEGRLAYV